MKKYRQKYTSVHCFNIAFTWGKNVRREKGGGDFKTSTTNQNETLKTYSTHISFQFWKLCTIREPAMKLHD